MNTLDQTGLSAGTITRIQQVFASFPTIHKVILYGSRAKGTHRPGSDIDLTIKTTHASDANLSLLLKVMRALDDLELIYTFDVSLWDKLEHQELRNHIERVGIVLHRKV